MAEVLEAEAAGDAPEVGFAVRSSCGHDQLGGGGGAVDLGFQQALADALPFKAGADGGGFDAPDPAGLAQALLGGGGEALDPAE